MIDLVTPMRRVTHEFEPGMSVDIIIDDFPALEGDIVRTTEKTLAISFFPNSTDQKTLMANILTAMENESSTPHSG